MKCIGIDVGYGRVKVYGGEQYKFNYPSAASTQIPVHTFGDISLTTFTVKGATYLVGEEAIKHSRSIEDTRKIEFVCSPLWFALFGSALHVARFDPLSDVVAIGLPPGDLGQEKEEMIRREIAEITIDVQPTRKAYSLSDTKLFIVPQAAGIYFSYLMNHHEALHKNVIVVDVGHQTLDIIYMNQGVYIEKYKETKDLGVSRELDGIIQAERSRPGGRHLSYADIVARMSDKSLIDPASKDYIPPAFDLLHAYTRTVLSTIQAYLDFTGTADVILIGGGGAQFLVPDRDENDLLIVDQPEMANAVGYWAWAVSHM